MDFKKAALASRDRLVAWRRDFHQNPELAFEEHRSAAIVAAHLESLGYVVRRSVGKTGVVGTIGKGNGPVVLCRFDMDGLPICEQSDAPYASTRPGVMHACGHDAHMAIGMGLAELLAAHESGLEGKLVVLFQPAEEVGQGARAMIEDGVLDELRPDIFLACHVWLDSPVGSVDVRPGPVMSAAEVWRCKLVGLGGHGAMPHLVVDPIVAAAQVINSLQTIVSRNVSPLESAVVSVGSIHGGEAMNVIPGEVQLTGTIRTFTDHTREIVLAGVERIIEQTARAHALKANYDCERLTPALRNDPQVTMQVESAVRAMLGEDSLTHEVRTMGSEDAAFFMERVPGCFFFVGAANPEGRARFGHHHPRFDLDEDALVNGLSVMAKVVGHYLGL